MLGTINGRRLTNVNVGLSTLEGGCHSTGSQSVLGENMVDRVSSTRPEQRGPAGAQKEVGGSGDIGHPDNPAMKSQTQQHEGT